MDHNDEQQKVSATNFGIEREQSDPIARRSILEALARCAIKWRKEKKETDLSAMVSVIDDIIEGTTVEVEVTIHGSFRPGEEGWFNAMEGEGEPGFPDEIEFLNAFAFGEEINLTKEEKERAEEFLLESLLF